MPVLTVSVGFEYESCLDLILWEKRTATLQGYELDASNMGGWTLDKHHILDVQNGRRHNKTPLVLLNCSYLFTYSYISESVEWVLRSMSNTYLCEKLCEKPLLPSLLTQQGNLEFLIFFFNAWPNPHLLTHTHTNVIQEGKYLDACGECSTAWVKPSWLSLCWSINID